MAESKGPRRQEPELPGDLPPLPSRFYKGRPQRFVCRACPASFASADELNEHVRHAHRPEAGAAKRR
jgi:hypothetical protein